MSEQFIKSSKPYIAAKYSKKKVGIGVGGGSAVMFIAPRAGDDFDDEMLYTIELMRHANVMYEMLKQVLASPYCVDMTGLPSHEDVKALLTKARGES